MRSIVLGRLLRMCGSERVGANRMWRKRRDCHRRPSRVTSEGSSAQWLHSSVTPPPSIYAWTCRWSAGGGELVRLKDAEHAAIVEVLAAWFRAAGFLVEVEASQRVGRAWADRSCWPSTRRPGRW